MVLQIRIRTNSDNSHARGRPTYFLIINRAHARDITAKQVESIRGTHNTSRVFLCASEQIDINIDYADDFVGDYIGELQPPRTKHLPHPTSFHTGVSCSKAHGEKEENSFGGSQGMNTPSGHVTDSPCLRLS